MGILRAIDTAASAMLSRLTRPAQSLVAIACTMLLSGCLGTFDPIQRSMLYFPQPLSSGDAGVQRELSIDNQHTFYRLDDRPGPHALLYFGGNGDDAPSALPLLRDAFPERALYVLEYRSFGESSGNPSERALVSDALELFDQIHVLRPDVLVMGRSLGTGIAIQVAASRPASGLILVTPYCSVLDLAEKRIPYLPLSWIMTDRYESVKFAPQIKTPTLMLLAAHDDVVPRESSEALGKAFSPRVLTVAVVPNSNHSNILDSATLIRLLQQGEPSSSGPSENRFKREWP